MAITYLNKQTIVVSIICIIVVISTVYFAFKSSVKNIGSNPESIRISGSLATENISSSTDWQKTFYDVSSKSYIVSTTTKTSTTTLVNMTNTDLLGRNFLVSFAEINKQGLTKDQKTIQNVANQLITDSLSGIPDPKTYFEKDITTINDSAANIQNYAKEMTAILANSFPTENAAVIATNAFEKNDMTILKDIDKIIYSYRETMISLLSIKVPQSASQYHLELINGFNMELSNAVALRQLDKDPILGLKAISQEIPALQRISTALAYIQNFFNSNNIKFVAPLPGQ